MCRIPVDVSDSIEPALTQLRVIASVYQGTEELASTGLSSDRGFLIANLSGNAIEYETVPLQFALNADLCAHIDGLRIERAWCRFAGEGVEPCQHRIRFASASPEYPLFLPLN